MDASTILVTVLVGAGLPFVAEFLNNLFQIDDKKALALAGLLSAVLAMLVLFLTNQLTVADFTLGNFSDTAIRLFAVGTVVFQSIKVSMGWTGKPDNNLLRFDDMG